VVISIFILFHCGVTFVWILPRCPIKQRTYDLASYYMLPTGLWQYWAMFAPNPQSDSLTLEAEVIDAHGLRHVFAFTRLGDYSWWAGIPLFRHSKYVSNMAVEDLAKAREFGGRHAVRKLGLPADAFPVDVRVMYQVRKPPPLGELIDPMAPITPCVIGTYHIASLSEVRP
jgi:hypothetical protein